MTDARNMQIAEGRRFWQETVNRFFRGLELDARPAAGEIAESLAVFCQQHAAVHERGLALLAARSFCAAGDREAADRALRACGAHRNHSASWMQALSAADSFPELYPLFASGILRPARLASAGPVWVLDLGRIRLNPSDRHELLVLHAVRTLAAQAFRMLAHPDAPSVLGVRGTGRLARFLNPRRASAAAATIHAHLHGALVLQARTHGRAMPSVLMLDL